MQQTAVIMAGGRGERFWPQSRTSLPKQFMSLTNDEKTMLQLTIERLLPLIDMRDIFIVTNKNYRSIVATQIPGLPAENILCEPVVKNTAPCIAFATAIIQHRYGDAVIHVMPSDHTIQSKPLFIDTLRLATKVALQGPNLVTLGITPTYPETGYGYIKFVNSINDTLDNVYAVDRFVEKPDSATAESYLLDGSYLWNSGMFTWLASTYMDNVKKYLPDIFSPVKQIQQSIGSSQYEKIVLDAFNTFPSISVDYGIMEKAENVYVIPASFGWDDVGSWLSLERINTLDVHGSFSKGNTLSVNSERNIVISNERLIATVGIQNTIVVETGDAVLVCDKDNAQEIRQIVNLLKEKNMKEYL